MKLTDKERGVIMNIMISIQSGNFERLDIKKMTWEDNMYRVRKWNIRIVYTLSNNKWLIKNIEYRGNIYQSK